MGIGKIGVLLDSKLNLSKHMETICKKTNGMPAFLKRNLCNPQIRSQANSYVIYKTHFGVCLNSLGTITKYWEVGSYTAAHS